MIYKQLMELKIKKAHLINLIVRDARKQRQNLFAMTVEVWEVHFVKNVLNLYIQLGHLHNIR
jgi:hypothetical protein